MRVLLTWGAIAALAVVVALALGPGGRVERSAQPEPELAFQAAEEQKRDQPANGQAPGGDRGDISIVLKRDAAAMKTAAPTASATATAAAAATTALPAAVQATVEPVPTAAPSERPAGLLESLREAEGSRVIFSGRSASEPEPGAAVPSESSQTAGTGEPSAVELLPRAGGQPRGYAMLYAMHPRARATVEQEVDTMLRAQLEQHYLGVLTDGTFGSDLEYLATIVRRLSRSPLTLSLYLTNGATMRNWDRTPVTAGFNRIEPAEFRGLIRFDPDTRQRFRRMVQEVAPIFDLNLQLNPQSRNIAIVMLEDNLDAEAYFQMREIARSVLGGRIQFVRNPCPGCYEGNDTLTLGDPIELHRPEDLLQLNSGDGFTMDGNGFAFPGETGNRSMPISNAMELASISMARGVGYFGIWRFNRQGLTGGTGVHPDERIYEVPSEEQSVQEVELLRHGLVLSDPILDENPAEMQ